MPFPGAAAPTDPHAVDLGRHDRLALQILDAAGRSLWQEPAPFYPSTRSGRNDDQTGIVEASLPDTAGASSLQLLAGDRVVASFSVGPLPARVTNIRAVPPSRSAGRNPVIAWDDEPPHAGVAATEPPKGCVYSVQLSSDDGSSWQSIGLGLQRHSVAVDPHLLQNRDEVKVRVTSTDGFHAATREETIRVCDLLSGPQSSGPDSGSVGRLPF